MDATERPADAARPARFWISLAMLAAVVFAYVLIMTNRSREPLGTVGPMIGRRLPVLSLVGLTGGGESVSLDALRGRVVLVNYWGTWCPPCIREFPDITALAARYGGNDDFRLLAVSCGEGADTDLDALRDETERFLQSRSSDLPTYADPGGSSRQAMSVALGVQMGYPTTVLLDRQGTIRGFWQGYNPRAADEMRQTIETLLAEYAQ